MNRRMLCIGLGVLVATPKPASAWCIFNCDTSEQEAQQFLEARLRSIFKLPVVILNFKKTNGVKGSLAGEETYEMQFTADVDLPQGIVRRDDPMITAQIYNVTELMQQIGHWESRRDVKVWEPSSWSLAGRLHFRRTEKGWEGF